MATTRAPSPRNSSAAVVVMPSALAAAMPYTPHSPAAGSPAPAVTASPTPIEAAGYHGGRSPEKNGRTSAPTMLWPSSPHV